MLRNFSQGGAANLCAAPASGRHAQGHGPGPGVAHSGALPKRRTCVSDGLLREFSAALPGEWILEHCLEGHRVGRERAVIEILYEAGSVYTSGGENGSAANTPAPCGVAELPTACHAALAFCCVGRDRVG